MLKHLSILFYLLCIATLTEAQEGYWVTFTDKKGTPYTVDRPSEFLSQRALDRRKRQMIHITEQDLPVTPDYLDFLRQSGIDVRHTSKWFNAAIVFSGNSSLMESLDQVSFIRSVEKTKPLPVAPSQVNKFNTSYPQLKTSNISNYGAAWHQTQTVNGHLLHQQGYTGHGLHIAILDAGYHSVDNLPLFQHLWDNGQILGTKDFVNPSSNIFTEHKHGMNVLSIIGGKAEQGYIGTAPDASYWLLRTEDAASETPIEPDYWICAAEFADSIGIDILNTSLGYSIFDPPSESYSRLDMDGSTRISQASQIAASKGMLLVTSAGNDGLTYWRHISAPADAPDILAVGAISMDSTRADFSSVGPTFDNRVKPEVSAMGVQTAIQNLSGTISLGNGTSYSAPVITGMAACLWQAFPDKTAAEIRETIIRSAHQYNMPDDEVGYGIPNFNLVDNTEVQTHNQGAHNWKVSPNPFTTQLIFKYQSTQNNTSTRIMIYDVIGNLKLNKVYTNQRKIILDEVATFPKGIYVVIIEQNTTKQHIKVIKSN